MRWRRTGLVTVVLAALLVLSACAAGPNDVSNADVDQLAGFWLGLWHGLIHPVTFVISLFNSGVNLYEVHNNGGWYNFGFVLGVGFLFTVFLAPARAGTRRG